MSLRMNVLALLDQGPCYGYQLRTELDRRTGSAWPVNVGQVYNTLDRLERDGLVATGGRDEEGHVIYAITAEGSREVQDWFGQVPARSDSRDDVVAKVALAATLPGVDVRAVIAAERQSCVSARDALPESAPDAAPTPDDFARGLIIEARRFTLDARLRWLDQVEARITDVGERSIERDLAVERPRRGRPAKTAATAA
ncbi:PadR family transcriptional regulator [Rathayibacter sp. YIM 133350]|uniref:PadR family transcriptional regulator n=1 Tax=Rathayibacter sp. YIM 133350 TaxID=3131992 RepID=UPI00307F547F